MKSWIMHEGDLSTVKVPAEVSAVLKRQICDSFVAKSVRSDVKEQDFLTWLNQ